MSGVPLSTVDEVVRGLITYTDWWQPASGSVLQVGRARRTGGVTDGFPEGLLRTLDVRTELCRRMEGIGGRDRELLFLWYVRQLHVEDIAKALRISRRQCFRVRSNAIRKIVELGEPERAA